MKNDIQQLRTNEISSDVFVVAPSQIDNISKQFGDIMAETMHVRSLSQKICQIAKDVLIETLTKAKSMGA